VVQALIEVSDHTNMVLNVVKAKYGLRDKSEAIETVVEWYEKELLEPELRPEFVRKMKRISKEKPIRVKKISDLGKTRHKR